MEIKTGLIGFFDILGYENLLKNNEPEEIAIRVLPILTNLGDTAKEQSRTFMKEMLEGHEPAKKSAAEIVDKIGSLVFSDTILLTMPTEQETGVNGKEWIVFLRATSDLMGAMFHLGLPLRGVIEHGKYCIEKSCFAGRAIVDAYNLCNQLDLSACVLSEGARKLMEKFDKSSGKPALIENIVNEYLVPLKGKEKHYLVLQTLFLDYKADIKQQILNSFWKHKKDIPQSARTKVDNTLHLAYFLKNVLDEVK